MPSVSPKQRTVFCIAEAIKKGRVKRSSSKKASEIADSMSLEKLKHYCESPLKEK